MCGMGMGPSSDDLANGYQSNTSTKSSFIDVEEKQDREIIRLQDENERLKSRIFELEMKVARLEGVIEGMNKNNVYPLPYYPPSEPVQPPWGPFICYCSGKE